MALREVGDTMKPRLTSSTLQGVRIWLRNCLTQEEQSGNGTVITATPT
jgi:hypothetical protein